MNFLPLKIFSFRAFMTLLIAHFSFSLKGADQVEGFAPKPVVDFYSSIDDKSFYQQKRIHGMKGELNNYSKKLHNLQERFDRIFYGLSAQKEFQTPFDLSNQPARPLKKSIFATKGRGCS